MKKAVGYIWVNDPAKVQEIRQQEQEIALFCKIQNLKLVKVYVDAGKNNRDFNGENWKHLEDYLYRCHYLIDCILVTNPDRLSRNPSLYLKKEKFVLDQYNINIAIAITDRIDHTIALQPFFAN
jgi:DNA invertase Pin-like site-specific DNA recombinase